MERKTLGDLLELVSTMIPESQLFIGRIVKDGLFFLKAQDKHAAGEMILDDQRLDTLEKCCQKILTSKQAIILHDISSIKLIKELKLLYPTPIRSYAGVPIYKGEMIIGILCATHQKKHYYDENTILILERCSRLFSYVLELEHQAMSDMLTKTYNRRYLYENFKKMKTSGTLLSIDLDGFKEVNDQYGHAWGDKILVEVSNRLKKTLRDQDILCRIGGDEFIIILPEPPNEVYSYHCAQTIIHSLSDWSEYTLPIDISVSIGIVHYQTKQPLKQLMQLADEGLYKAKQMGKGTYMVMS